MARPRAVPPAANDNRPPLAARLRKAVGVLVACSLVLGILLLML